MEGIENIFSRGTTKNKKATNRDRAASFRVGGLKKNA